MKIRHMLVAMLAMFSFGLVACGGGEKKADEMTAEETPAEAATADEAPAESAPAMEEPAAAPAPEEGMEGDEGMGEDEGMDEEGE